MSEAQHPELSDRKYLVKWGQDLIDRYADEPKVLGKFFTAHMIICRVRELREAAYRGQALNALFGNVSADMMGRSEAELRDIAGVPPVDEQLM